MFTLAWLGNRLTQSIAWAGLIKVSSKWFDYSSYGMIIGILSISYLIGDAAARQWMGMLIERGYGWRALFYFAAAVAGVLFVANVLFLRESRTGAGYDEAKPNPLNLFAESESRPRASRALLLPLLRSRAFVLVCLLSLGCTIIRETFNMWTPVYLRDYLGYSMSNAAGMSAVFPGVGAVSVLITGWLSDRLGVNGRALLLFLGLAATAAALLVLMSHAIEHLGCATAAVGDRNGRVLPARTLFLPRRRIRLGFRRQASVRGIVGHHRRGRLSGRGSRRRQRREGLGGIRLAGRVRRARGRERGRGVGRAAAVCLDRARAAAQGDICHDAAPR